jgi:hypothetical protein
MRIRIASTITTEPSFERMKLMSSHSNFNNRGNKLAKGLAMWTKQVDISQVKWQGNNLQNSDIDIGNGGWTQTLEKGKLNSITDTVDAFLIIPQGICTAHPITIKVYYGFHTNVNSSEIALEYVPAETVENLISDSTGGLVPIVRDISVAALTTALTPLVPDNSPITTPNPSTSKENVCLAEFIGIDVSDYYAGDFIFIQLTAPVMSSELSMLSMSIQGVGFTDGNTI